MSGRQGSSWSCVGRRGKHKHCPPRPAARPPGFMLASLPGPALCSIFSHLDCISAHQLALTCTACASEFVHRRPAFVKQCRHELLPEIQYVLPRHPQTSYYDQGLPVHACKWTGSSDHALPLIYALSQQPGFLTDMWKAAWPASFVEDVLGKEQLDTLATWTIYPCYVIGMEIFVHSNTALRVPWDWLHGPFLESAVAVLVERLSASGVRYHTQFNCRLYRAAQAGQWQDVMWRHIEYVGTACSPEQAHSKPWSMYGYGLSSYDKPDLDVYVLPSHTQKVAVTGPWCKTHPDARFILGEVRTCMGAGLKGVVSEDQIAITHKCFMLQYKSAAVLSDQFDMCKPLKYAAYFDKHYTKKKSRDAQKAMQCKRRHKTSHSLKSRLHKNCKAESSVLLSHFGSLSYTCVNKKKPYLK